MRFLLRPGHRTVAAAALLLLVGPSARAQTEAWPGQGLGPFTGLAHAPSAFVLPNGWASVGLFSDSFRKVSAPWVWRRRQAATVGLGLLPCVEVMAGACDTKEWLEGSIDDRLLAAKWQVLSPTQRRPAVAIGTTDTTGTRVAASDYAVASWRTGRVTLHGGIGRGELRGLFGGADTWLTSRLMALVEHDSRDVSLGLRARGPGGLSATVALVGGRRLEGALAYTASAATGAPRRAPEAAAMPLPPPDLPPEEAVRRALAGHGFEDVRVSRRGGGIDVGMEDRLYRNPETGMVAASEIARAAAGPAVQEMAITLTSRGAPVVTTRWAGGEAGPRLLAVRLPQPLEAPEAPAASPPQAHADLLIGPRAAASLGGSDIPYRAGAGAELRLRGPWGLEARALGEAIAADTLERRTGARLAGASLSALRGLAPGCWGRLSAERLADGKGATAGACLWTPRDGRYALELQCGFAASDEPATVWASTLAAHLPLPRLGAVVSLTAGRWAGGDAGATASLLRRMSETELALSCTRTVRASETAWIVGAKITVPLGPVRAAAPSALRIRVRDRFDMEYRARTAAQPIAGFLQPVSAMPGLFDDLLARGRLLPGALSQALAARVSQEVTR
jgi:hypothetical protein